MTSRRRQSSIGSDDVPLLESALINPPTRSRKADAFESLDYDVVENIIWDKQQQHGESRQEDKMLERKEKWHNFTAWVLFFIVGVVTAVVAFFIDYFVKLLMKLKFDHIATSVDHCQEHGCLALSLVYFLCFNCGFVLIATSLTALAPVAAGSGIPEIKCYLNGIKLPGVTDLLTMVAKAVGVLFSVAGGMFVGKEGPMIHSGAIVGAGITQGESTNVSWLSTSFFQAFRTDRYKRDFVSAGAAAGVAAAFGAPIGGVLFSLEEGASFWNQALTWKSLFCSMSSAFVLNLLVSGIQLHEWGQLDSSGLVNFGKFNNESNGRLWNVVDLGVFLVMGALGGVFGAMFNEFNKHLTIYRMKHVKTTGQRIAEALLVAMVATCTVFILAMTMGQCRPISSADHEKDFAKDSRSYFCKEGEYNDMATLALNPQEITIKTLFHMDGTFSKNTLAVYFLMYLCIASWTYGLSLPSGLFVPCLVTGAAYGRLFGALMRTVFGAYTQTNLGTYALIGAAAFLGGVVRMTISLTVILIESTDEITLGLPLMVTLMAAKFVGDLFNEGLYDIHIELKHIPLLGWEPSPEMRQYKAKDVMVRQPISFMMIERVSHVVDVLASCNHQAFPVIQVDQGKTAANSGQAGGFSGLILRSHILIMLHERILGPLKKGKVKCAKVLTKDDFVYFYSRRLDIHQLKHELEDADLDLHMDLTPYMSPCPFTVWDDTRLPRVFNLFRTMGLRHLVVLKRGSAVVAGIITRKDLAHVSDNPHAGRTRAHTLSARTIDSDDEDDAGLQAGIVEQGRPLLPMAAYRLQHDSQAHM
eukprot:m.242911 g.242911  ORF g.242911 m.242911 type:complete len:811 (+) comp17456_c0_seq2:52-2484(+)